LQPGDIRYLRTWLGLSRSDLAAVMGIRRETAFRWERGDARFPMTPIADRLLRLLVANRAPGAKLPLTISKPRTAQPSEPLTFVAPDWRTEPV